MKRLPIFLAVIGAALIAAFASCELSADQSGQDYEWGSPQTRTVPITVTPNEQIYLVKYNPSPRNVPARYSGSASSSIRSSALPQEQTPPPFGNRYLSETGGGGQSTVPGFAQSASHHKAAMAFNALPPPERTESPPRRMTRTTDVEGVTTKNFWVQNYAGVWISCPSTLRKIGTYCKIWVANASFGSGAYQIEQSHVDTLNAKFTIIYPKETAFFGYELGGGPGGDGGIDGDPKIQILVYDIDGDEPSPEGGTLGFFWGKDEYTQATLEGMGYSSGALRSNAAEIIYLDAYFTKNHANTMYSTLAHEFQHLIQYNTKTLHLNTAVATWYNEMLSMLAEDMLYRHIFGTAPPTSITRDDDGVPQPGTSGHPIHERIPYFIQYYWASGVTDWLGDNVFISYSNAYAFGAYLVRNYGGAKLLYEIAHNNFVDIDSVNAALAAVGGANFTAALEKFPRVLVNTTATDASFNRTDTTWTSPPSGITASDYTFGAFDIGTGLYGWTYPQPVRPYGIEINYLGNADATGGNYNIPLTSYQGSPVKMYLLGKKTDGTVAVRSAVY